MCGIVAFYSRNAPISPEALRRSVRRLSHRGPDGEGIWVSTDGLVGLGHARLSIIDLETGDQPIASEDGRIRIVVNGEFYGYEAIRRELESLATAFARARTARSRCISTRISALNACHGCAASSPSSSGTRPTGPCSPRVIASASSRSSMLIHEGTVYFASEVKALFAAGVPARWDHGSFYHATDLAASQTRTLFDGVFQVPPGHYLLATDRHLRSALLGFRLSRR